MYASTEQRSRERVQVLADQLYHHLLRIARRNGADADADDVVNDAVAAFLDKFDPDCGAPPLAWAE